MITKNIRPIVRFTLVSILTLNGACATEDEPEVDATQVEAEAKDDDSQKQADVAVVKVDLQPHLTTYDLKAAKK